MKILGVFGSIRPNGNTDWMVNKVLDSAKEKEAEIDRVFLRDFKHIGWCTGCDVCHYNGGNCVQKDDMQAIYPKLIAADIIVLGCPNYFKSACAITKNFMDRTNCFVRFKIDGKRRLENKYCIGMSVGGEELEDTQHVIDQLARFFKGHKMKTLCMMKARADEPGEISDDKELESLLEDIGRRLADDLSAFESMENKTGEKYSVAFFKTNNSKKA